MAELFKITQGITFKGWPTRLRKEFRKQNAEALGALGVFWHRRIFPRRFTQAGARELRFQLRDPGYQADKRERGENVPLVSPRSTPTSGRTKRQTMGRARIRATSKRLMVRLDVPNYITRESSKVTKRGKIKPDMKGELTRVSPRHLLRMAQVHNRLMTMRFKRLQNRETRTVQ